MFSFFLLSSIGQASLAPQNKLGATCDIVFTFDYACVLACVCAYMYIYMYPIYDICIYIYNHYSQSWATLLPCFAADPRLWQRDSLQCRDLLIQHPCDGFEMAGSSTTGLALNPNAFVRPARSKPHTPNLKLLLLLVEDQIPSVSQKSQEVFFGTVPCLKTNMAGLENPPWTSRCTSHTKHWDFAAIRMFVFGSVTGVFMNIYHHFFWVEPLQVTLWRCGRFVDSGDFSFCWGFWG